MPTWADRLRLRLHGQYNHKNTAGSRPKSRRLRIEPLESRWVPAITLSGLNPKDVLQDGAFEEYDAGMGFFFSELVDLNAIIYLAEEIVQFPLDLFIPRDSQIFFYLVMRSFHDSAILIITRLVTDQKGDLFTLLRFKNRIRELIKSEYRDAFEAVLKAAGLVAASRGTHAD